MRLSLIFAALLFLLSIGESQEITSRLSIYSNPNNVKIRIDSVLYGKTPLENIELKPGDHQLEALSPYEGLWNMTNIRKTFNMKSEQDTTIRIQFEQYVKINSIPYNAKLIYNNNTLGLTPTTISYANHRGKQFSLEKKGYNSRSFVLKDPEPKLFELEPLDLSDNEKKATTFTHSLFRRKLKTKFLFLTGTVATHWLAFYLKNVADDNYQKYTRTSNPQLMDKYWDNSQKYDRLSEISLGVSYVLLSGLIYHILWN